MSNTVKIFIAEILVWGMREVQRYNLQHRVSCLEKNWYDAENIKHGMLKHCLGEGVTNYMFLI